MYIASKILPLFVYPLGLFFSLAFLAWLVGRKYYRLGLFFLILAPLQLWLAATPKFADMIRWSLERQHQPLQISAYPQAAYIVVLGGGVEPPARSGALADLNAAADRLLLGARLYKAGKSPRVLVAGGKRPWSGYDESEAAAMARVLKEMGVNPAHIDVEDFSRNTHENAAGVHTFLRPAGVPVLLVTSALHMPRALATFRKLGINAIPAATDFRARPERPMAPWDFLPDANSLLNTTEAIKEYLGMAIYRLRGWA